MNNAPNLSRGQAGYSLIEMMATLAIMGIVSAIAIVNIGSTLPGLKSDGAMRIVMTQLNTARETAITQRRNFQVSFINGNRIQIIRQNLPAGTTLLSTVYLEGGLTYRVDPSITLDTPENFGKSVGVDFGTAIAIIFSPDGTLVNQSGVPVNGTVFLSSPNTPQGSARAITVLGATGRVRGYRWSGQRWERV
jgi:prepilin-type N-terminal cleavage/methylation domain-containing protein